MEAIIKPIIAEFLRTDPSLVSRETVIDKTAVKGSILVHRMYGVLGNAGVVVNDYISIKTYGQLLDSLGQVKTFSGTPVGPSIHTQEVHSAPAQGVGIDIEQIRQMPATADYRTDEFYKQNFTSSEISYCVLQINPQASFAGLFAAKEAITKANASLKVPFSAIEIDHAPNGKPVFPGFTISIAHTEELAVAVAARVIDVKMPVIEKSDEAIKGAITPLLLQMRSLRKRTTFYLILSILSVITALIAVGLHFS